ncbi:M48 family metalloprotease [Hydrogenovibrio halophilus]|uniref:M48 family metalloprotease n=1 Tax=Hydrogenovibrio halophilus TaxID=373391 RepID=UPI00036D2369|nr:M48 family metalloprotease [Hydrogenovibrio halophilus]
MMKTQKLIAITTLLASVNLTGCNPIKSMNQSASAEAESKPFTASDYSSLELKLDPQEDRLEAKRSLMPLVDLPRLEGYLNGLLEDIIVKNELRSAFIEDKPEIKVSVDTAFNAVTLPNGLIVINTGMLTQLETETELHSVIAHELMHILNGDHTKDNMQEVTDKGLKIAEARLAAKMAKLPQSELLEGLPSMLGQQLLDDTINAVAFTKWNREQEQDADLSAIHLLHNANLNEKYFLKFLKKRKEFEENNPGLFVAQNNETSKVMDSMKTMIGDAGEFFSSEGEAEQTAQERSKDSMTGKYFSAHTRIKKSKDLLINEIGKQNLNRKARSPELGLVMPDYRLLKDLYRVNEVNTLLEQKKSSQALRVLRKAMRQGLEKSSYLRMVMASIRDTQGFQKKAQLNREMALKDPNATLSVYSNVIAYYDAQGDKQKTLALVEKINKELDYPNAYLPITIKLKKKYGASTKMEEVQCVRTVDVDVMRGCQKALGRHLNLDSKAILSTVAQNETDSTMTDNAEAESSGSGIRSFLPF